MKHCTGCGTCDNDIDKIQDLHKQSPDGHNRTCGVVLIGNSKVGKSTLFNRITSRKAGSANIKSLKRKVEKGIAGQEKNNIYNPPGTLSIFSNNTEERAARDILLPGNVPEFIGRIVVVADAKNLKRAVSLALQYAEYGLPMLFVLNMMDEAAAEGINIDSAKLSSLLGIPVCETVARNGQGVQQFVDNLHKMERPCKPVDHSEDTLQFFRGIREIIGNGEICAEIIGLLFLNNDAGIKKNIVHTHGGEVLQKLQTLSKAYNETNTEPPGVRFAKLYNKRADDVVKQVLTMEAPQKRNLAAAIGQWCMNPVTGIPIAAIVITLMYLFVGTLGATLLVDAINSRLFEAIVIPKVVSFVDPLPSEFIKDMIVDPDFGILPTGVFLALGLVTPVLFCFYIAFGVLEDSGYLSRLAILLDRVFQKMGLNGKGVIPLVMGFSCVTMAILTTRLLDTEKEKNIVSFLLLLGMPCAPLLAVMLVILDSMSMAATLTVFGLIFTQILVAGFFSNRILFGVRAPLIMEIQPIRIPRPYPVIRMAVLKTYFFIKEALPVFIFASFVVFLFERLGGLSALERLADPVVSGLMGLPEKSVQVFIKTIIRRESGATEIQHLSGIYDSVQLVVNLLVMTFLSPCINATIVLIKERGVKKALFIMIAVMVYAVVVGSVVNHACRLFGVTFA